MLNKIKFALPLAIALGLGLTAPAMAQTHFWQSPGQNPAAWAHTPGYTNYATPRKSANRRQDPASAYARGVSHRDCVGSSDPGWSSAFPSWEKC
jgi:hypothetical protein